MSEASRRTLVRPSEVKVNYLSEDLRHAELVIEPLERGFGFTLGNALRRVLLSSLTGAAVTSMQITGVSHEFAIIPGVKEDYIDVYMNIKSLVFSVEAELAKTIRVSVSGPKIVTGADLQLPAGVRLLNSDQHICTLGDGHAFEMVLTVEKGRGYVPATEHNRDEMPLGVIPVDSIFTPVKRVFYTVGATRVGQSLGYDKLTLTVETNGTVRPDDAVALASKILQEQFSIFINFDDTAEGFKDAASSLEWDPNLLRRIDELELSVRSMNCLKNENIVYVGDLVQFSEDDMMKTPNFGRKSLDEIKQVLRSMNLYFGMNVPYWPPENIDKLSARVHQRTNLK